MNRKRFVKKMMGVGYARNFIEDMCRAMCERDLDNFTERTGVLCAIWFPQRGRAIRTQSITYRQQLATKRRVNNWLATRYL